jgi:hypothetical protein
MAKIVIKNTSVAYKKRNTDLTNQFSVKLKLVLKGSAYVLVTVLKLNNEPVRNWFQGGAWSVGWCGDDPCGAIWNRIE